MSTRALEALDRILNRGGDADDILRSAVGVLVDEPGITWAGIAFQEEGILTVGPQAGEPEETRRIRTPVVYRDSTVGELWVDGEADAVFLDRFALLISQHVLIGWDTQGQRWDP